MWSGLFYSQSLSVCASFMAKLFLSSTSHSGTFCSYSEPPFITTICSSLSLTLFYNQNLHLCSISISLCCSFHPLLVGFSRFCLVLGLGESFLQCKLASDVRSSQGWPWTPGPSVSISQGLGSQPLYFQLCLWISFISSLDLTDGCRVSI